MDKKVIAISETDRNESGCPYCGYRSSFTSSSGQGCALVNCADEDCRGMYIILIEGLKMSPVGIGDGNGGFYYPELQEHPLKGTPKHGNLDIKADDGSEIFKSRGIGLDHCRCFKCDTDEREPGMEGSCLNNIAAFVQCKESGERIVALFDKGARLDYREYEPDRVQVKVGACNIHLPNLKKLDALVKDGLINAAKIEEARKD